MKTYPQYKNTGVEWIGMIPNDWSKVRICNVCNVIDPQPDHRAPSIVENGSPYIGIRDVLEDGSINIESTRRVSIEAVEKQEKSFTVNDGDIIFCKVGTLGLPKFIKKPPVRFAISATLVLINSFKNINSRFLRYSLESNLVESQIHQESTGSTRQALGIEKIRRFIILYPGLSEQSQIATFLDYKTRQIDDLIAKKQKLIELLHEERTILINQAVTKGLDPSVPMKDSGIEWLGEIPDNWNVEQISNISRKITNGYVGPTRDILRSSGIRYLQSLHIKDNRILFETEYFIDEAWSNQHSRSILKEEDVLIVQTGDIGQVAVVPKDFEGCNCHALIIITPKKRYSGLYLAALLNSEYGFHKLKSIQKGALHPHLNSGDVKYIKILTPPLYEQLKIVKYVTLITSDFNSSVAKMNSEIQLFLEYKTSLINEAVTGKIDVRDYPINHG